MSKRDETAVRFACPSCGGSIKAPPGQAGQHFTCPRCDAEVIAPGDSGQVARAAHPAAILPADDDDDLPRLAEEPQEPTAAHAAAEAGRPVPLTISPAPAQDAEYGIVCPLCGTRLYVRPGQVGQEIRCPDCHKIFAVPPPPPLRAKTPQPSGALLADAGDDFQLSETFERPKWEPLVLGGITRQDLELAAAGPRGPLAETIVACPACGRRLYATPEQVGTKMVCVDCKGEVLVQAAPVEHTSAGSYQLPTVQPGTRDSGARGHVEAIPHDPLGQARREYADSEYQVPPLPKQPLVTRLLQFFKDPEALLRWGILAGLIGVEAFLITSAIALAATDNPVAQFGAAACSICAAIGACITLVAGSVTCLAVLQDTAHGLDRIISWPDISFLDWVQESLYVIVALSLSAAPGMLLLWTIAMAGGPPLLGLLLVALSLYVLYPFVQISMLEANSYVMPFSKPVWNSLTSCFKHWGLFYAMSAGLLIAGGIVLSLSLVPLPMREVVIGASLAFIIMLYYRLLGRLAWACQEAYTVEREE